MLERDNKNIKPNSGRGSETTGEGEFHQLPSKVQHALIYGNSEEFGQALSTIISQKKPGHKPALGREGFEWMMDLRGFVQDNPPRKK